MTQLRFQRFRKLRFGDPQLASIACNVEAHHQRPPVVAGCHSKRVRWLGHRFLWVGCWRGRRRNHISGWWKTVGHTSFCCSIPLFFGEKKPPKQQDEKCHHSAELLVLKTTKLGTSADLKKTNTLYPITEYDIYKYYQILAENYISPFFTQY